MTRRIVAEGEPVSATLPLVGAHCATCGVAHLVEPGSLPATCPSCGRGQLAAGAIEIVGGEGGEALPERVVPFVLDRAAALAAVRAHVEEGGWFLVGDLSDPALDRTLRRLWWPEWLVDADVDGVFSLEVGFDYQVKSNKERHDGTKWTTFEELDTRIRWEPRVGRIRRRLENVGADALVGVAAWSARTGSVGREADRPFHPDDLHGAVVRVPDLPPDAAWGPAVERLSHAAGELSGRAAEAQHQRGLALTADWARLHWTWRLLPAWTCSYDDGTGTRWLFVVNGQTGAVTGARLKSTAWLWGVWGTLAALGFATMGAGAVTVLVALPLLALAVGAILLPVGIIAFVVGLLGAAFCAIPLFSGLSWNRSQREIQPSGSGRR